MPPDQIKKRIQDAYLEAVRRPNFQTMRAGGYNPLLRDVTLFGREAGNDFVESRIAEIVEEAVELAKCKEKALGMVVSGFGEAAIAGMTDALERLTALRVTRVGPMIRIAWAEENPGLL